MHKEKNINSIGAIPPHTQSSKKIIGVVLLVLVVVGLVLYDLIVWREFQSPALTKTQIIDEIKSTSGVITQVRDDGTLILELHLPDSKGGTVRRTATLTSQTPMFLFNIADGVIQTAMITSSDLRAGQKIEIDTDKDIAANETIGVLQLLVIAF